VAKIILPERSPQVRAALEGGHPVVALESTIIAHGMPYPKNVETALRVEEAVRTSGAVPATIAIIKGKLKAGLSEQEIEDLGRSGTAVPKASRRDLALLAARGLSGATTVAGTMAIAHLAGISVFCTGGIGGVHRGAAATMDISADLEELGRTPVLVVCAGVKSILAIGLTLEYLETKGVPVLGYQTDELPAFYTIKSGFNVDYKVEGPAEIAAIYKNQRDLGFTQGVVVGNPIRPEHALKRSYIEGMIDQALVEAERRQIKGKAITPFLLDTIQKATGGKSLEANIELVLNNAKLAAEIAVEYSKLKRGRGEER